MIARVIKNRRFSSFLTKPTTRCSAQFCLDHERLAGGSSAQLWAELPQLMRQAGLAQYMRPRQLVLCRAMPLGPSGKVLKREIRRLLLAGDPSDLLYLPDQAGTETRGGAHGTSRTEK